MKCRHCNNELINKLIDLGHTPPSNAYIKIAGLKEYEKHYPLKVFVCEKCWLVQTEDYAGADELFTEEYAYFSSTSATWLKHAKKFVNEIVPKLNLNSQSFVVEVASNDGYLLRNFIDLKIPCLGIEPTASTAGVSESIGIPTMRRFFGSTVAKLLRDQDKAADLIIGNNVFAHVPMINDFSRGLKLLLKPQGTVVLEFPHLLRLLEFTQFDTIYHEHFSYLSLYAVNEILKNQGLKIYNVEELATHGGSIRVYACHETANHETRESVQDMLVYEFERGLQNMSTYNRFQEKANQLKNNLLRFLIEIHSQGKSIAGYGAAAKGNTLLNYAGVKSDLLPFICDSAVAKQGKYTPGGHIPILHPDSIRSSRPDYILILPWNIADEVVLANSYAREWGARFAVAVPELRVF